MIKKNNRRKETSTSLEKFKKEDLKNINLSIRAQKTPSDEITIFLVM